MKRLITLFFAHSILVSAQAGDEAGKQYKQACTNAEAVPLPSAAAAASRSQLRGCNSEALYYGFDGPPNGAAALPCAYYERAHPQPTIGNPFYGPGILTMLYANGRGVPRNYDLAIRFACEDPWAAPAEKDLRIARLQRLRETHASPTNFDLCDDITSGLMMGACQARDQKFADAKRRRELEEITRVWPSATKAAFPPLQTAEDAFVQTRIQNEVDLSGTARAAYALEEQGRLRDQFLANLKQFAAGKVLPVSAAEYERLDQELNDLYRKIQQRPGDKMQWGTVSPSGVRRTELAWLKMREAWVEFARAAYPSLHADTVRAQITRLRILQLAELRREMAGSGG